VLVVVIRCRCIRSTGRKRSGGDEEEELRERDPSALLLLHCRETLEFVT